MIYVDEQQKQKRKGYVLIIIGLVSMYYAVVCLSVTTEVSYALSFVFFGGGGTVLYLHGLELALGMPSFKKPQKPVK